MEEEEDLTPGSPPPLFGAPRWLQTTDLNQLKFNPEPGSRGGAQPPTQLRAPRSTSFFPVRRSFVFFFPLVDDDSESPGYIARVMPGAFPVESCSSEPMLVISSSSDSIRGIGSVVLFPRKPPDPQLRSGDVRENTKVPSIQTTRAK
jgi:hypothetical protein